MKLRYPILAVVIFAIAPLQLRYALESRPYALSLALSAWSTVVFLDLVEHVTWWRVLTYCLIALLGLYTQPYTIFVPVAHLAWLCCTGVEGRRWRLLASSGASVALAALGFLPWYLWTTRVWSQSVAGEQLHYTIGWKAGLLIWRELVGAGYLGSALILGAAWIGLQKGLRGYPARLFWVGCILSPVLFALITDAAFGYFLAIRQMIFLLVPLSLLAALGVETWLRRGREVAAAFGCVLLAAFLIADVRFFLRPHEDWGSASSILKELSKHGSCVVFAPANSEVLYRFFVPELSRANCRGDFIHTTTVALAASPYGSHEQSTAAKTLLAAGFHKRKELNSQGPTIAVYER